MFTRDKTRRVTVGGLAVGGGAPVSVQSMCNTNTRDVAATVAQIRRLEEAGCEIIRLAVPDMEAAEAFRSIKKEARVPLVADVHFDYRLALAAIAAGADKLRINPGNIGDDDRVRQVALAAKAAGIPIRVGVNGGSLDKALWAKHGRPTAEALCESALRSVQALERHGFTDIIATVKSSDVPTMIDACRLLACRTDCPQHLGVTEAGTPAKGAVRSAAGLGAVLHMGLGDTVRVSLTGDPAVEVALARDILQTMGLRVFSHAVVSCPTCGRTEINLAALAERVEDYMAQRPVNGRPLKVAVMGCVVNGPGEAREADYGLTGGRGAGVLFKKGQVVRRVPEEELFAAFTAMVEAGEAK